MAMSVMQALDIGKCMVRWAPGDLSKSPVICLRKLSQMKTSKALCPTGIALEIYEQLMTLAPP